MNDHRVSPLFAAIAMTIAVSGCQQGQKEGSGATATANANGAGVLARQGADYAALSAAAEPFEALTEQAFSADHKRLAALMADIESSAAKIGPQLEPSALAQLTAQITDAKHAIADDDRAQTALASVEGYRVIVSAFPATAKIPPAVSLLDYAGFRIEADLKANPVRWSDAKAAYLYAQGQWGEVSGKIDDKQLTTKFQAALDRLGGEIAANDKSSALASVILELDLVDALESHFEVPHAQP